MKKDILSENSGSGWGEGGQVPPVSKGLSVIDKN